MDQMNINQEGNEGPVFQRSLKVHRDTISQIIFNSNK